MALVTTPVADAPRRVPRQQRSRDRVERILDAAARIVLDSGADAVTTRSVADLADVPVASIYQYFADRDGLLLALAERDMAEMDEQVASDLGALGLLSVPSVIDTTMRAFVAVYHRRPAFVRIYLRGRTNSAIHDYGRAHNRRIAERMLDFLVGAGLVRADAPLAAAELAVEIGDRVFQLAFEADDTGDTFLIDEGIRMVVAYLDAYTTDAGRDGVRP